MTTTQPTPRTVRPRQPLRLYCVEYTHAGTLYVTVVEAVSEDAARRKFNRENRDVKIVAVY